jgi:hypothetical protein
MRIPRTASPMLVGSWLYIYIYPNKTYRTIETNTFGNNVAGRQWWSFGAPKR